MHRLLVVGLVTFVAFPAEAVEWEELGTEDGITVWQRAIEGQPLVEFRGRGHVKAGFKKILAVFYDDKRKTEWLGSCVENRRLAELGPGRTIFYNRTGSSFPLVADRDAVIESATDIWRDKRRIRIDTWNIEHPSMPPVEGVVRMPDLRASWVLQVVDDDTTEVTYTVRADPGGALPSWVVNWVAKSIPRQTIQGLREQVKKGGYEEDIAYVERSFDWSGFIVKPQAAPQQATAAP